jgi:hypothetical protein
MTDYNKAFKVKHGLEATTATVSKIIFGDSSEMTTAATGIPVITAAQTTSTTTGTGKLVTISNNAGRLA